MNYTQLVELVCMLCGRGDEVEITIVPARQLRCPDCGGVVLASFGGVARTVEEVDEVWTPTRGRIGRPPKVQP